MAFYSLTFGVLVASFSSVLSIYGQEDSTQVDESFGLEVSDENSLVPVSNTFYSTRVINAHSIETLRKGVLEFRIEHRFGDIAGSDGGAQTFFGFDNASDIRFAFEYGISDRLMVGLGRSKGTAAPYRSLIDGFVKYRILQQTAGKIPVSITAVGSAFTTYMKKSNDISLVSSFPKWEHRMAYAAQLNVAKKFGNRLSLALMPTFVHRNYVPGDDINSLFSLGGAVRLGITSTSAILLEYHQNIHENSVRKDNKNSLGIAYEWVTFGHNFTINLTNSKGFTEAQFIPYTFEDWMKGQFRLGFCISRKFEK